MIFSGFYIAEFLSKSRNAWYNKKTDEVGAVYEKNYEKII